MKDMKLELHQIFKMAREAQGIKQSLVAKKGGIAPPSLSQYENGHATLSTKTLLKLAPILNINPSYIKGESANPFLSKDLIKMFLPERFLTGMDYAPIEFLVRFNSALEIVFLIPASRVKAFDKVISKTIIGQLTIAILIRDQDGNTFILRRKTSGAYLVGELDLQAKLSQIAKEEKKEKKELVFRTEKITRDLFKKIKDWTVTKRDVEALFSKTQKIELSADEKKLIDKIRAKGIDPKSLLSRN